MTEGCTHQLKVAARIIVSFAQICYAKAVIRYARYHEMPNVALDVRHDYLRVVNASLASTSLAISAILSRSCLPK